MQLFDLIHHSGPMGSAKVHKRGVFPGLQNKTWDFWVMYKTELEGDPETFPFGSMQLFLISGSPEDLWSFQYKFVV